MYLASTPFFICFKQESLILDRQWRVKNEKTCVVTICDIHCLQKNR